MTPDADTEAEHDEAESTPDPIETFDSTVVDDLDDLDIDPELFEKGVLLLSETVKTLTELQGEVTTLEDVGLTHGDTVALLYGRRNSLNKTEIKAGFSALESVGSANEQELIKRLLADYASDLNKSEAEQFVDELYDLRRRYAAMGGDDADE